jgi:hypothetical protein
MSSASEDFGPQYISPRYTVEKISPGTFADWVDVWEDRMWGWWLSHADALRGQPHSEYMMVHIAIGIIETLEVMWQGKDSDGQTGRFFREGFLRVFAPEKPGGVAPPDVANIIYKAVRCGLSHTTMVKGEVFLVSDDRVGPLQLRSSSQGVEQVIINPPKFVDVVIKRFRRYVHVLRVVQGPAADERRARFEDAWHELHARKLPRPESART